jgi:RimJ/RimL family protein N-acetyltransferase
MHKPLFPEVLQTKRTTLRRIELSHAMGWKAFNNAIAKRMDWPIVPSVVYARNEILHYQAMWDRGEQYIYIVLDKKGKVIGDLHIKSLIAKRAEIGHALHPTVWGTGITYEVLTAVQNTAARKALMLWGKVEEENIRSWRSLEKHGATFIGARMFTIAKQRRRMRVYELR